VHMGTEGWSEGDAEHSVLVGKCQCGAVRYRVPDAFLYAAICHCSRCRAATGSAFKPFAGIEREKLEITDGLDALLVFGEEDSNDTRCRACGSLLGRTRLSVYEVPPGEAIIISTTQEAVGGFDIIECGSLDEAVEIPCNRTSGRPDGNDRDPAAVGQLTGCEVPFVVERVRRPEAGACASGAYKTPWTFGLAFAVVARSRARSGSAPVVVSRVTIPGRRSSGGV
jgi:hypothetical protein